MTRTVGIISALTFDGDPAKLTKNHYELGERLAREQTAAAKATGKNHNFKYVIGADLDAVVVGINKQVYEMVKRYGLQPTDFSFRFLYEAVEDGQFYLPYGRENHSIRVREV